MGPYFFERRHIARYARVDAEQCAFTDLREHAIFALRNLLHGNIERTIDDPHLALALCACGFRNVKLRYGTSEFYLRNLWDLVNNISVVDIPRAPWLVWKALIGRTPTRELSASDVPTWVLQTLDSDLEARGGARGVVTLSVEELKDVVSTTAFWVIVREGFGGVGKVTRKGDGWRIRA